ncbi:hypothetical protein NA56DRAFT_657892 [Hyaloscypha hepaticicola]|uniref:Uncharacterized protein n=1 Tax=Hyaloscypha hepaticicola TaxID=2082293 RepID=A0A2J6Q8C4_9HELO|nr:hypothetical protein NA56DRAFT_657892 [Hyaloscypha hepaticicola]
MSICGFVTGVASSTRLSPTFPARRSFECRHAIKKYDLTVFAKCDSSVGALDWYNSQLDISQLGVCRLLRNAEAVGETLLCIFTYRNEEATRIATNAIHDNGRLLAELATLSNQSTDAVSRLTMKTQKDSRAMKVLTVVAALYLPATLMATIFSSNLVQLIRTQSGNSGPDKEHFAVAPDFWMFPTFTSVLMILTLSPVWL